MGNFNENDKHVVSNKHVVGNFIKVPIFEVGYIRIGLFIQDNKKYCFEQRLKESS